MCRFWATIFPCGCFSWRSSGYEFCEARGTAACTVSLKKYMWKTFCPHSRKVLRGRQCTPKTRLPPCYEGVPFTTLEKLCRKCDSSIADPSQGPALWHCRGHFELVSDEEDVDLETAEKFFEGAIPFWPIDHRGRYLRRKGDVNCKGTWWSY